MQQLANYEVNNTTIPNRALISLSEGQPIEEIGKCPISLEWMKDPVIAADGYSYDRTFLLLWLRTSNRSPMMGEPLATQELTPNYELRDHIYRHLELELLGIIQQLDTENLPATVEKIKRFSEYYDDRILQAVLQKNSLNTLHPIPSELILAILTHWGNAALILLLEVNFIMSEDIYSSLIPYFSTLTYNFAQTKNWTFVAAHHTLFLLHSVS